jgi:hypothetical protein
MVVNPSGVKGRAQVDSIFARKVLRRIFFLPRMGI